MNPSDPITHRMLDNNWSDRDVAVNRSYYMAQGKRNPKSLVLVLLWGAALAIRHPVGRIDSKGKFYLPFDPPNVYQKSSAVPTGAIKLPEGEAKLGIYIDDKGNTCPIIYVSDLLNPSEPVSGKLVQYQKHMMQLSSEALSYTSFFPVYNKLSSIRDDMSDHHKMMYDTFTGMITNGRTVGERMANIEYFNLVGSGRAYLTEIIDTMLWGYRNDTQVERKK